MRKTILIGTLISSAVFVSPASARCFGTVHYYDAEHGEDQTETFEITAFTINKKTDVKTYGGHGTNWYPSDKIKVVGQCHFIHDRKADDDEAYYYDNGK